MGEQIGTYLHGNWLSLPGDILNRLYIGSEGRDTLQSIIAHALGEERELVLGERTEDPVLGLYVRTVEANPPIADPADAVAIGRHIATAWHALSSSFGSEIVPHLDTFLPRH